MSILPFTFDNSNRHQPGFGDYHYHASHNALRYQLNDNSTLQTGLVFMTIPSINCYFLASSP